MKMNVRIEKSVFDIYTENNVINKVPKCRGLYFLWAKHKTKKWECIYVGHATNLQSNLLQHLSAEEPNREIKAKIQKHICGYEWALVSGEGSY